MFKKNKNVLLHSALDEAFYQITPAKSNIPDWYKKGSRFINDNKEPKRMPFALGFKLCAAFGDSFTSGYVMPLPFDIAVEQTEGGPVISWRESLPSFVNLRDKDTNTELPVPNGYSPLQFAWQTQHVIKIPKGYSALMTHPFNRYDLPFITLSGIVDGEISLHEGNVPFHMNTKFEGIIPAGTPIMQILLFKTENWTSKIDKKVIDESILTKKKSAMKAYGWYKQNVWKKKMYD